MTQKLDVHPVDEQEPQEEPGNGPATPSEDSGSETPEGTRSFTQAELDEIITARLARQKASIEEKAKAEAKKRVEQDLKEQQKYQELAEARQQSLEEVTADLEALKEESKGLKDELKGYKEVLEAQLENRLGNLPKAITDLMAGLSPLQKLQYLEDHSEDLASYSGAEPAPTTIPVPSTPAGSKAPAGKDDKERRKSAVHARTYL